MNLPGGPAGIRGELCDFFVREEFKDFELTSPYSASIVESFPVVLGNGKANPVCHLGTSNPMETYRKNLEEKFGSFVLPAFLVKGKNIFLEVKIDGKPTLKEEQEKEFGKVLEKGYKIFIIVPKISMKPRKIEVEEFECFEFLGTGKRKECSIEKVKERLKN